MNFHHHDETYSNERSPLLTSTTNSTPAQAANSGRAYSENSSREEARPVGELQVTDNSEVDNKKGCEAEVLN
jgi:hypothetical protein